MKCKKCNMEFDDEIRLNRHKKTHKNKPKLHDGPYWTDPVYYP